MKAYSESRFIVAWHLLEVSDQLYISAAWVLGKDPRNPLNRRLGVPPEPVWMIWRREKSLSLLVFEPKIVQHVA